MTILSDTHLQKPRETILLAEDDPDAVLLFKMACARSRLLCAMQTVSDGQQAIDYLAGAGKYTDRALFPLPIFLLLDLKMPRQNGFEVLSWIRASPLHRCLPVLVFTSSGDPIDITRAYNLGANSYAVKPTGFDELIALLNRLEGWWIGANQYPTVKS